MSRTYKTTDPATLAAMQAHADQVDAIRAEAKAFCEHFGAATPAYSNSISSGLYVYGLVFEPAKDTLLWTAPDRETRCQRPRHRPKTGTSKGQRLELKALQADWELRFPKDRASWEPVLDAIGTDWGPLFFHGGFSMFEHAGVIYIQTSVQLADHCVEIFGSEYEAARAAQKKEPS